MLFLFVLSLLRSEVAGVRTVDLAATCGRTKGPVDISLAPFEMSAVVFKFGSQAAPMPPAFVHKMPNAWQSSDDSEESHEAQSGYIFENHNGTMHLDNLGDAGEGNLHRNLTSSKRERRKRGLFSMTKSAAKSCHFHLTYEEQKLSGMHFGIEDISLDTERTCSEFIEISGTNVYYETTERKICGKDLTSTTVKVDTFEEIFIGNLTIKVSISATEGKSMFRFVVTGFNIGDECNAKSFIHCPTSTFRDEYESLKSEPLCIWGGLQCDSHSNCPFSAYDEKGHKCPKSSLLRQKQSNLQSRQDEDMANLSRLVLGISVFFVCVLCVISCQFIAAKRKFLNSNAEQPSAPPNAVTIAVTESSRGMNAPPPSYSDVMSPPPAYDTVVGLESIEVETSCSLADKVESSVDLTIRGDM